MPTRPKAAMSTALDAVASVGPAQFGDRQHEADRRGGNPRAEAAEAARNQDRGNEQDQLQVAVQRRVQQQADDGRQRHGHGGDGIVADRPRAKHSDGAV